MASTKNENSGREVNSMAELARRLHLSRWTVSRVLNGHDGVHPETAARVRKAMLQCGFSPNALAQGLKRGHTKIIGICLPEIEGLYLGQKLDFLRRALTAKGYHVMVGMTNGDAMEELATLNYFRELRAEGVVLVASQIEAGSVSIRRFLKGRTPLILIDPMTEPPAGSICVDRAQGMLEATRHLLDLGHRRIATLGLSMEFRYTRPRLEGIAAAYKERGLDPERYLHHIALPAEKGTFYERGREVAATLWKHPHPTKRGRGSPTAVLALNDRLAIGLIDGLREMGVRVPEDLSLIGYDNMEVGAFVSPRLTTIDAQPDALIREAIERLLQRIGGKKPRDESVIHIPARLLCRESTGRRWHAG